MSANLKDVFERINSRKKEANEIKKAFKDNLLHDKVYQDLLNSLKTMKEQKKSIENQAWSQASSDAAKLDMLKLDIKSDKELLSDIALNEYVAGRTVEVIDDNGEKHIPGFSVNFKKSGERQEQMRP